MPLCIRQKNKSDKEHPCPITLFHNVSTHLSSAESYALLLGIEKYVDALTLDTAAYILGTAKTVVSVIADNVNHGAIIGKSRVGGLYGMLDILDGENTETIIVISNKNAKILKVIRRKKVYVKKSIFVRL